jgi:hypothetical protein
MFTPELNKSETKLKQSIWDVRCAMWDKVSLLKSHISYLTSLFGFVSCFGFRISNFSAKHFSVPPWRAKKRSQCHEIWLLVKITLD